MNPTRFRFSTVLQLAVCAPLVVVCATLACRGRLIVSNEPVVPPDAAPGPRSPLEIDARIVPVPAEISDSGGPSGCSDGSKNGEESDIDCGGYCPPCATGFSCNRHEDCRGQLCRAGVCAPTCDDFVKNGNEFGVDCGGDCPRCRSATCNCASSAGLSALSCDETRGERYERGKIFVSNDGQTALYGSCWGPPGRTLIDYCVTFRWTRAMGLEPIALGSEPRGLSADGQRMLYQQHDVLDPSLFSLVFQDEVSADYVLIAPRSALLSPDGTLVVGIDQVEGSETLVRWTRAGGVVRLAALSGSPESGEVTDLTADGSVVVGQRSEPNRVIPFRWTEADGLQDLEPLPNQMFGAFLPAVNADGSVILAIGGRTLDLFRWTSNGLEILGLVSRATMAESAMFVSKNGSVVAWTRGIDDQTGVRWTVPGGVSVVFSGGRVGDMSADGALLVGQNAEGSAVVWDRVNGARRLQDIAVSKSIDTRGWQLGAPKYVAEDGSYVFGTGLCGETPVTYRFVLTE